MYESFVIIAKIAPAIIKRIGDIIIKYLLLATPTRLGRSEIIEGINNV